VIERAFKRGDVLLIEFRHSDLTGVTVRPVVVVSNDRHNAADPDLVCLMISSRARKARPGDFVLRKSDPDFQQTGLWADSVLRISRLQALERTLVLRYLGRVSERVLNEVSKRLAQLLELPVTA